MYTIVISIGQTAVLRVVIRFNKITGNINELFNVLNKYSVTFDPYL